MKGFFRCPRRESAGQELCTGYRPGKLAINFSDCSPKGMETLKNFHACSGAVSASKYPSQGYSLCEQIKAQRDEVTCLRSNNK